MKISLNWLSNFIDLTEKDNDKIKEIITARSAEIETMEDTGSHLDKVVLGQIAKIWQHPNADKLKMTLVDNGKEKIQVVCGGSNLEEGMKVAFAQLGAIVKWHGTDVVKMEKAKIRGEESFGMICAAEEVGLDEMFPKKSEHEIVDLSHINEPVGTPLTKALGLDDVVIDVDNHAITNRPDLFSHRGFAREFVACGLAKWKNDSSTMAPQWPHNGSPLPIEIEIKDKDTCSNYLAVYLTGIEVKDSPDWMKQHLIACGIRPISNIVDVTNYVMLELGMPMHAFDLDQVKGKKWTMRKSEKGEKVITLDEKEIELFEGITVFDDGNELFDLCGIMGGLHSGINQKTNRVLLHAPVYNPELTRRGVRGLGQISDAAVIYEKGVDNELAKEGLARSIELILELCPDAKIASEVVEYKNYKPESRSIKLRKSQMERLIGCSIPDKEVKRILNDLEFELKENKSSQSEIPNEGEGFEVTIPSWRLGDIHMEADLIEEVARIYGYDEIPFVAPKISNKPVAINTRRRFEKEMKDKLVAFGFNEIYTFAFLGPELLKKCGMEQESTSIEVTNPISSELSIMRESLLPWTIEMIADNTRYQKEFKLFELARTYHKKADKAEEESNLIITTVGSDFRELQGTIEHLGFKLKPSNEKNSESHQHPGRMADIILRGQTIGSLYELHPQIGKNFGIKERITIAEINMESIHAMNIDQTPKYKELPKYPSIQLDVSVLIPKKNLAEEYTNTIQKTDKTLVKSINLIDEYEGESIGSDKRSLTYSITYRADDRTLKEEEVSVIHQKVLTNLKTIGASIRD